VCERARYWIYDLLLADKKDNDEASSSASASTTTGKGAGRRKRTREEEENLVFEAAERAWGNGFRPNLRDSMSYL